MSYFYAVFLLLRLNRTNKIQNVNTNTGTNNESVETNAEQNKNTNQNNNQGIQNPISFDDFLKDSKNQAEFDKRVQKAIQTDELKWNINNSRYSI